jgi:outer membrane receptor protein involved in Fe transport
MASKRTTAGRNLGPSLEPLAAAVALALAGLAGSATAQPPPGANTAGVEEVTVTGTRITRDGMSTPTPVTAVTADDLSMMSPGNIIDSLDYLPAFFLNDAPDTAASKSASAGAANVNLRGLDAKRTLVLLDGRRVVPSNRLGSVDINLFPEAMIERVDVMTGGASAAYGTDAVAGVVNFILKQNYEGFDIHTQYGVTDRSDGQNREMSIGYGTKIGERGHFMASLDGYDADAIETLEGRDWFKSWGLVTNPGPGPRDLVRPYVVSTTYTFGGLINAPGTPINRLEFLPDGTTRPFVNGALVGRTPGYGTQTIPNGGSGVDPVADRGGSLVPSSERDSLFAHYRFDISDKTNIYVQLLAGDSEVNSVGTLPLGIAGWAGRIYSGNPFLPANVQDAMTLNNIPSFGLERYHSTADLAHDRFITENDTRSLTFGVDSELETNGFFDGWRLGAYAQLGKNDNTITEHDFIRTDRLPMAMDAVVNPANGQTVCRAALFDPANYGDCVPIDLLGVGRASQAALDYVTTGDEWILAKTKQDVAEFSMNGEVGDGWGAGAVSLAFGAGWRKESLAQTIGPADLIALSMPVNDPATCTTPGQPGCRGIRGIPSQFAATPNEVLLFTNVQPISGSYTVSEAFAETLLPLVAHKKAFEQLDLDLAVRYADYEGSGGIWAWKAGLDWKIVEPLRFRTTVSRDIRAATLSERFDRQGVGTAINDPVFGGQNYTTTQIIGGNPALNPEEADTLALGFVYQPKRIDGLSMSVDYYDIDIAGALAQVGVQVIVDQCFAGNLERCSKVSRDPATNRVTLIDNGFVNQDAARVVGTDLEIGWRTQLAKGGSLNLRFLATVLNENSTTTLGSPKRDVAGETGDGSLPELKSTTYVRYNKGKLGLFAQERFIGGGMLDYDDIEGVTIDDNSVDARYYTDMGVTWDGGQSGLKWQLFLNVQNLFDRDPPVAASWAQFSGTRPTNDRLFDFYGRRFALGVNFTF